MTFDLENPDPLSGDALRDEAANLLESRYGRPLREPRVCGKKVDLSFTREDFGKKVRIFVEAKDYNRKLKRDELVHILTDYSGLLAGKTPTQLLIITRQGLTTDAQSFVEDEQASLRHQTIWELENEMLGLTEYIRTLSQLFDEDGLSSYYIESRARGVSYAADGKRIISKDDQTIYETIQSWLSNDDATPIAILGGYGAGKTSLAKRLISTKAKEALANPLARRPIFIRLGAFSRYSNLAGLLGGMFTHDFPVDGFNAHRFLDQNRKGRLFIVLDGFDEMKHAMTWADFRSTLTELNHLVTGNSKVLLLGRPNALTSEIEHNHVLRGMKKFGNDWTHIPGWPKFGEFDLQDFSAVERTDFVFGYLRYRNPLGLMNDGSMERLKQRADEVNRLADLEPEVFGKPVHTKILTDLAADPNVDLSKFGQGVSRWHLYETFFLSLAEREMDKEARRPITEQHRLEFLREIAFWLWSVKGGGTAFSAHDIPDVIFERLPQGDAADLEAAKREYLTGSFLEKKSGDIYYFNHRSFAEFLVAERMIKKPPEAADQAIYSRLVQDGVLAFLADSPYEEAIKSWRNTLPEASGTIHLEYISFLTSIHGSLPQLVSGLPSCPLSSLLHACGEDIAFTADLGQRLIKAMRTPDNSLFYLLLHMLQMQGSAVKAKPEVYAVSVLASILDRVFESAEADPNTHHITVPDAFSNARNLAVSVIPSIEETRGDVEIIFNGVRLLQMQAEGISLAGIDINSQFPISILNFANVYRIPISSLLNHLRPQKRDMIKAYLQRHSDMKDVIVKSFVPGKKRRQSS